MSIDKFTAQTGMFVICDQCGKRHPAEYSHHSEHGQGAIYAVVCDDWLTDYYTTERLVPARYSASRVQTGANGLAGRPVVTDPITTPAGASSRGIAATRESPRSPTRSTTAPRLSRKRCASHV